MNVVPQIAVLDEATINEIAAGEVVERPASVVKELIENAIDAGASAITAEIREGGIRLIRITDNGCGMEKEDAQIAFLRHSTSKIRKATDLLTVSSLGFRGEALSSIAAVAQVELLTKTRTSFTGVRYVIEGGEEKGCFEIGCPEGTTFLVHNLFYNTPARRKFLKSPTTEAGYVSELIERLAVSHPEISFKFINNNKTILHTSGNRNLKDIIYYVYGREIATQLLPVFWEEEGISIGGFLGKPVISRGNRNYENYFINGRYIKSSLLYKAIEEAYKPYTMQYKYPFTVLHLTIDHSKIDVNVHPTKMELRFSDGEALYHAVFTAVKEALAGHNLIVEAVFEKAPKEKYIPIENIPEPFESNKKLQIEGTLGLKDQKPIRKETLEQVEPHPAGNSIYDNLTTKEELNRQMHKAREQVIKEFNQTNLFEPERNELSKTDKVRKAKGYRIIGQLFSTYWMVESEQKLFMIDQHAAHEKILYEHTIKKLKGKETLSQMLNPPIVLSLSIREEEAILTHKQILEQLGFTIESFGSREYFVRSIPADMFGLEGKDLLLEFIDDLVTEVSKETPDSILEKIASLSCHAAVKGNHSLSKEEARALIDELMTLENPYHCPHGRPVIISMTKQEIEKKFKR